MAEDQNKSKPTPRIGNSSVPTTEPKINGLGFTYDEATDEVTPVESTPKPTPKSLGGNIPAPKPKPSLSPSMQVPAPKPKPTFGSAEVATEGAKAGVEKLTPAQKQQLKVSSERAIQQANVSLKKAEQRKDELDKIMGKRVDSDNLFLAAKDETGKVVVGRTVVKTPEELESLLQDPYERSVFYNEQRGKLAQYFYIRDAKDFDNVLSGGLSEYEKYQYTKNGKPTIFSPVFNRQTVAANQPGYKPQFDQFAPDPVAEAYAIPQKRYEANQNYTKLQNNKLNVDAYGQPFKTQEDFYDYLIDPVNRDAYSRKYSKALKEIGITSVNDILNSVVLNETTFGAELARQKEYRTMRVAKGESLVENGIIGKSGTVYDENENSTALSNISELDLGRVLYEYDLGNNIGIDIPNAKDRTFNDLNRDGLVDMLTKAGLSEDEIDEVFVKYKMAYERSLGEKEYESRRKSLGYTTDAFGNKLSRFDLNFEARAKGELSAEEQKIAKLYDQIDAIYAIAEKPKTATEKQYYGKFKLTAEQTKQVTDLRAQIEQLKGQAGFFGLNNLSPQEFFDSDGNRLEGEDKDQAQVVYSNTLNAEKKTDRAILKEKRNVLYVQLDGLEKKLKEYKSTRFNKNVVLPEGYDPEELDERYNAARDKEMPYLAKVGSMITSFGGGGDIVFTDQMKANFIYERNLKDKIIEKKAQIRAANQIIYTNTDLTKVDGKGVGSNFVNKFTKDVTESFTGGTYLTPSEEVIAASDFLQQSGQYVNPEVVNSIETIYEDKALGEGILNTMGVVLQMGLMQKPMTGGMTKLFTSQTALTARAYMANRYGRTGIATFNLIEKAATTYGKQALLFEAVGQDGSMGAAEELGNQVYDKVTGTLGLGRFVPANLIGKLMTVFGRTISGAAGSFTEESFANVWAEFKSNGFDIREAVENAYGKTEDERLLNLRMTAFTCIVFSAGNLSNLGILFKTRQAFSDYLQNTYGNDVSEFDSEILTILDSTIKNTRGAKGDTPDEPEFATATATAVENGTNETKSAVEDQMVMSTGPVESDQNTSTNTFTSSGVGNEGVQVERRTGNMGEEFYVSSENGVVDNKVVYRYNMETGQLEAQGLTSTTDEFVPLNDKSRQFVEDQSKKYGIVSKEKVENIAIKNLDSRRASQEKIENGQENQDNTVLYQSKNKTSKRKEKRMSQAEASARARYQPSWNESAQQRVGLFTGIASEVSSEDDAIKEAVSEMSKGFGVKMKINLVSFFKDGAAVITDVARKKFAHVSDYMAPLFRDFDNQFFNTQTDEQTGQTTRQRQQDNTTDKVREAVARNTLFEQVFGKLVAEGKMTKEDAIDNFIINLMQNSTNKVKEIFGNDKAGIESFQKLRKDFNNFVAVKYTGANTFSTTNAFVRNTPMSNTTSKNRAADLKKQAAEVAQLNEKRRKTANVLSNTQKQGAFIEDKQVDAAMFLDGDLNAEDFLQNIGVETKANETQDQVQDKAKKQAEKLIDYAKYTEGKRLVAENDATREKYRKQLNKKFKDDWGLKASFKTRFRWKKMREQRTGSADMALRIFENKATRMGITLQEFMDTRIEMLKRTEQQFQDWLKMSPNLVPLFQNAANLNPEEIYPNVNKAKELKEKNYPLEKITLMTGVVLNEAGVPVAFDPKFVADVQTTNEVYKGIFNSFKKIKAQPKFTFKFFGKRTDTPELTSVIDIRKLFTLAGNKELYNLYPDLGLVSIRTVVDANLPAVSFRPNYMYDSGGDAKKGQKPGEIVINLQKYEAEAVSNLLQNYNKLFTKNILPQLQQALRQAVQHIEGELPESTIDFATPTAVRTKLLELRGKKLIDENTEKLVNDIVDFYIDKNLFQFTSYKSVFTDISRVLFSANTEKGVKKIVELISNTYDLSVSDSQTLESIYNNYMNSYGEGDANKSKSLHNAFLVSKSLAGLNNEELIVADVTELKFIKAKASKPIQKQLETAKTNYELVLEQQKLIFESYADILKQFDLSDDNHAVDVVAGVIESEIMYGSGIGSRSLETALQSFRFVAESITEIKRALNDNEVVPSSLISDLEFEFTSSKFAEAIQFLYSLDSDTKITLDDGSELQVFTSEQEFLDFVQVDQGIMIDDPVAIDSGVSEMIPKFIKAGKLKTNLKTEVTELENITDAEARESFYDMFPGIQNYMGGIYDPYKSPSDFTKSELQKELVDSGLIKQETFDKIYADYEANPEKFTGSVASNFIEPTAPLTVEEQQQLSEFLKIQELVEDSFSTSFYSGAAYATSKVLAQSKGKITVESLKSLLIKNGAKEVELNWLGFDDFISQYDTTVPASDLKTWSENIPQLFSYDRDSLNQSRTVDEVVYLGNDNFIERPDSIGDFVRTTAKKLDTTFTGKKVSFVIKRSDGTSRFVDLTQIADETLDLYESYIGKEKYPQFKETFEKLKKYQGVQITAENIEEIKTLLKLHFEASDEIIRQERVEGFEQFKSTIGQPLGQSYKEHLLGFPFSSNRLLQSYDEKILEKLEQLTKEKDFAGNYGTLDKLQNEITQLVKERNDLAKNYFDESHFSAIPNEVAMHMRTEIVVNENGERMLHVIEIQSDKAQNFRTLTLAEIKKQYPVESEFEQRIIQVQSTKENKNITREELKEKLKQLEDQDPTANDFNLSFNNYFLKQEAIKDAKNTFKKTSPIIETEQFVSIGIKHALKIASDYGVKKIVFSNGASIGAAVAGNQTGDKTSGLNKLYNETIPNKAKKLAKAYGFTTGTTKLNLTSFGRVDEVAKPDEFEFTLDPTEYPSYVDTLGNSVVNTGKLLTRLDVDEEFLNYVALETTGESFVPGNEFFTLELTDETFEAVAGGMALFQQDMHGAHGATVKTDQGKFIIFALTNPNITTAMHELAHVWEDSLTATEKKAFLKEVGHDKWTRATSEAFARHFEKYLADGKAPTSSLANLFANFKKWFLQVYGGIIGTPIEMKVSEPMRKLYDSMLGETQVKGVQMKKTPNVIEDIGNFIKDIKANPQFEEITDDELYTSLIRSGFEPQDVQDYFSLKQRANIEKQQQRGGIFKEEADAMENEAEAMRVVRDKKELLDAIDNIDPNDYPPILEALFTTVDNGDVPLAKAIMDLIAAKQNGGDPKMIHEQYSKILKAGTGIGRMLQLFKQLSKETYLSGAEAMFRRNEKQGLNIPQGAKTKIRDLANELDKLKDLYKESRNLAETDPYGTSKIDPSKTNLQYHLDLYEQLQGAQKRYIDARAPYEGDNSLTDMYRSFIKGGLMTPGSMSVNALSNITKYLTDLFVSPVRSGISLISNKLGITDSQYTKTGWRDFGAGNRYGIPMGLKKAAKILRDGTVTQAYQTPDAYVQGFNFYKSLQKFVGLKIDQYRIKAGMLDMTTEELAEKHGFAITNEGKISSKQQAIALLQGTFGFVPDVVFRVMGATDAVFRDFAYFSSVSEQFKFTAEHERYKKAIDAAKSSDERNRLKKEYEAIRKAYIIVNSDYKNSAAQEEAMRYVYNNDNAVSDVIARVQNITRETDDGFSIPAKISRIAGTSIIPFSRIPSNYAVELLEFFIPEYALVKIGIIGGARAVRRSQRAAKGELSAADSFNQRRADARDADRILARALIGTGIQFIALQAVKAGCVSGAPDDEGEDKKQSQSFSYSLERPYSINLTLLKDRFMSMVDSEYKSKRPNNLWNKEKDLIISYKSLGLFGAALYFQFKENKLALDKQNKFVNRGALEEAADEFGLNLFGNMNSAGKYIIDQTFVRGILSVAKAVTDEDENRLPTFFAEIVGTMASGLVPNSLSWIDKWRRDYVVDYDFRESPPIKMFGIKVEDPQATLFWMKLGTKLAERWPWKSIPGHYVDLPFVEIEMDKFPVKVDNFGKDVAITPVGSSNFGKWMYNTFDVLQVSRIVAGYNIPDWEALVYLAVKKGDAWDALPAAIPRNIETPFGAYKFAPEEYNNLLRYNAMLRRQLVQEYLIDTGEYKKYIEINSEMNYDPATKKPIAGLKNPNLLLGYEQLGKILKDIYHVADAMTNIANYTFMDFERRKLYNEDREKYIELIAREALSPMGQFQKEVYGNQEHGGNNLVQTEKQTNPLLNINYEMIKDPQRFKKYSKGAIKLFLQFQGDPQTAIQTAKNQQVETLKDDSTIMLGPDLDIVPLDQEKKSTPVAEAIKKQQQKAKPKNSTIDLGDGLILVPLE
jgi:hypothetical protein